jgi:hypothetical protein
MITPAPAATRGAARPPVKPESHNDNDNGNDEVLIIYKPAMKIFYQTK